MAYHHGDARVALLAAAAAFLETEGAAGLSLRRVAESAGLSRQAPYNHFADKEALLAELVREGFERLGLLLSAEQAQERVPEPHEATARLARAAEIYIGFGQEAPALFRLMFGKEFVDLSRHPLAQAAASAAFGELAAIVSRLAPGDTRGVSLVAWSLVHGYTSLCIEMALEPADQRHARAQLFARAVEALSRSTDR